MSSTAATIADLDRYEEFRERRRGDVAGPRGPVSFFWGDMVTEPGAVVSGAPGRWSPLPGGRAGLRVDADAAEGIRLGDRLVDGSAELFLDEQDGPTVARFADGAEGVVFTYDRSRFALQVWNQHSEWAGRFHGISAFPFDPGWRVEASVAPVADGRTVAITHHRDPRPVEVPVEAEVAFEHDGVPLRLLATRGFDGPGSLVVHFTDATSGAPDASITSYSAGRSLHFTPDGGAAVLDFNYAQLLPCSFSLAWNCPLPPAENRLAVEVRAGERNAVDSSGAPLL